MNSLIVRIPNDGLIPLVEKRPVLWDRSFEVPKRKKAKRKAWKDLCRELSDDFEEMDDEEKDEYVSRVKLRWQCLLDTFFKKKKEGEISKGGAKKYIYAEKMQFLEKVDNHFESADAEEKTDDCLKNSKLNCTGPKRSILKTSDETVVEFAKDRFSKMICENGFTDEPPKYRSILKQQAKDLEENDKTGKKANHAKMSLDEPSKDRYKDKDKSYTNKAPEGISTEDPVETGIVEKPGDELPKERFSKQLLIDRSIEELSKYGSSKVASALAPQESVSGKTENLKNKRSKNTELKSLKEKPSEESCNELLIDILDKELAKSVTSKRWNKSKSRDMLPKKRPHENQHTFKSTKSTIFELSSFKRLCDHLIEESNVNDSSANESTNDSPKNGFISNPLSFEFAAYNQSTNDELQNKITSQKLKDGNSTTDKYKIPSTENELSGNRIIDGVPLPISVPTRYETSGGHPTQELTCGLPHAGSAKSSSDRDELFPVLPEVKLIVGSSEAAGPMRVKPELSSTFHLFVQSVMPHLLGLDGREVLEFQMGVLQVLASINEQQSRPPPIPEQFLEPCQNF